MEIRDLRVDGANPFLNAEKWNGALTFSENFENIIYAILGNKFKGIYKPQNRYNINDYVWFNNKCYIITDVQNIGLNVNQIEDTHNGYYYNGGYYCVKNNKITFIKGDSSRVVNMTLVDDFAFKDSKTFFLAYRNSSTGTKIYKIPTTGKAETINSNFSEPIKNIFIDDFYGYVVTESNKVHKFNLDSSTTETYFEEITFANNYDIVSADVNNDYIYILNSNSDLIVVNKDDGTVASYSVRRYVKNIHQAKITTTDSISLFLFDGDRTVNCFLLEGSNISFGYEMSPGVGLIKSMNYSNENIVFNSESVIANMVSSEYQMQEVDARNLISNLSTIELKNAYFAIDFSEFQLNSNGIALRSPKGFKFEPGTVNGWIYSDGTNTVNFAGYNGLQTHGTNLTYEGLDFLNKTIIVEFYKAKPNVQFITIPVGQKTIKLIPSSIAVEGTFKTSYEVLQDKVVATVTKDEKVINTFEINSFVNVAGNTVFSSTDNVVVKKILTTEMLEQYKIDFLVNCSYIIPDHYLNSYLPGKSKNENGALYVKTANKSILSTATGIKVNLSANPELNDTEISLSTAGAKAIIDKIEEVKQDLSKNYSSINHKHKFKDLQEIPISSESVQGIVSLSSSVTSNDTTKAATPSAVKTAMDKANLGLSTAETKLPAKEGTVNDWYLRHTKSVSGNLYDNFKTGKTGFFCGSSLTNGLPWGSHTWKHYSVMSHANEDGYTGILGIDFNGDELGFTSISAGQLKPWGRIWTSKNFDPNTKSDNHGHPYLHQNGGTLAQNLRINGGHLDIGKSGNTSIIRFDAQSNDPGYIMHYENYNSSIMRFSVSDDRGRDDYFSWGSTPGGVFSQCAYMYSDGYFHTDGTIHSSGDIVAFSDRRLKKNIEPIKDPLKLAKILNGVIFDRIDTGKRQTGLIAQDVLQVLPEAVVMDSDGYYSVNYGSLAGLLVECIKNLSSRIEELEKK